MASIVGFGPADSGSTPDRTIEVFNTSINSIIISLVKYFVHLDTSIYNT